MGSLKPFHLPPLHVTLLKDLLPQAAGEPCSSGPGLGGRCPAQHGGPIPGEAAPGARYLSWLWAGWGTGHGHCPGTRQAVWRGWQEQQRESCSRADPKTASPQERQRCGRSATQASDLLPLHLPQAWWPACSCRGVGGRGYPKKPQGLKLAWWQPACYLAATGWDTGQLASPRARQCDVLTSTVWATRDTSKMWVGARTPSPWAPVLCPGAALHQSFMPCCEHGIEPHFNGAGPHPHSSTTHTAGLVAGVTLTLGSAPNQCSPRSPWLLMVEQACTAWLCALGVQS